MRFVCEQPAGRKTIKDLRKKRRNKKEGKSYEGRGKKGLRKESV